MRGPFAIKGRHDKHSHLQATGLTVGVQALGERAEMPNIDFSKVQERGNGNGETLKQAMARIKEAATLREWCESNLTPIGKTFECPACGSGHAGEAGRHTPAFSITSDGTHWKCFACNAYGDVFDAAGYLLNTTDRAEQANAVAEWAGVEGWNNGGAGTVTNGYGWDDAVATQDEPAAQVPTPPKGGSESAAPTVKQAEAPTDKYAEGRERERAYVESMRANIEHPDAVAYLANRGIDLETARAWGLGYDPNAGKAKRADGSWCRRGRIVIPWAGSSYYHIDRAIAPDVAQNKYDKPKSADVGEQPLWNPEALHAEAFFVVEGALDALAVQACGYEAVALGSTGGTTLLEAIKSEKEAGCALLLLDNDEAKADGSRAGQDSQEKLAAEMEAAGIAYVSLDPSELGTKDAAEAWARDRSALRAKLQDWNGAGIAKIERQREARYAEALRRLRVVDAAAIADEIADYTNPVIPVPTGFDGLDRALGGGLMPRNVYVVGGGTSMGKTSHTLQVADQIAASGAAHVLFVSIEQRAPELVAKSLSRLLGMLPDENGRTCYATPGRLTIYEQRMKWCEDMEHVIALDRARTYYRKAIAPRMHFMEAQSQPTVADVRAVAEALADRNGAAPVVFVDYLQLLNAPKGHDREDEKSVLKRNMVALRQLAGDLNAPVYVLAALNRSGSMQPMECESFRDSSNIEYSSDVLMGLQLRNFKKRWEAVGEKERRYLAAVWTDEEKAKRIRELELVIIKHRGGQTMNGMDGGVKLWFDAPLGRFRERPLHVQKPEGKRQ